MRKYPNIKIDHIDNVELHSEFFPFIDEYIETRILRILKNDTIKPLRNNYSNESIQKSRSLKIIENIGKVLSIISSLAIIVLLVLIIVGTQTIGNLQITNLFTFLSFTLFGGLISIGGANLISFKSQFKNTEQSISEILQRKETCPFINIQVDPINPNFERRVPGNPQVCVKCPLGIDTDSSTSDGLIHICKVYPELHRKWNEKFN